MISVIVPVYNAEAYVSRCLESILNQTYRDIRVVCVNDGSTDGTGAILEDFRRRDSRVEVLAREKFRTFRLPQCRAGTGGRGIRDVCGCG